jgi:DNA-binding transcriptional MerR regulator
MGLTSRPLVRAGAGSGRVGPGRGPDERMFTSNDVARIARVTVRQLQWWDERKLVSPRHEKHRRLYLPSEVLEILLAAELRRKGLSLLKIRSVIRLVRREANLGLPDRAGGKRELYLLTDGKSVHLEEGPERVVGRLKTARHGVLLVSVSELVKRLASELGSRSSDRQLRLF